PCRQQVVGDLLDGAAGHLVQAVEQPAGGEVERSRDELVLAVREMVVNRSAGGAGRLEHLGERRRLQAVLGQQERRSFHHPAAYVARHLTPPLTMTVIIVYVL